jgi:hypothetical protein
VMATSSKSSHSLLFSCRIGDDATYTNEAHTVYFSDKQKYARCF